MRKSLLTIGSTILIVALCTYGTNSKNSIKKATRVTYSDGTAIGGSGFAQTGCFGGGCHGSAVSTLASSVINGLPANNIVTSGTTYNISIVITDKAKTPTAKAWGFDLTSTDGIFATTNANILVEPPSNPGSEAHHATRPASFTATAANPSYTFDKITWTAPATPGTVTLNYACNAANGDGNATAKDHTTLGSLVLTVNPNTTPVTLASFSAAYVSNKVSLKWATATELNTDHFEIERSSDAKKFSMVNTVKASGTTSTQIAYSYTDNIGSLTGTIYYRLKSVDKNGVFNYSNIKSVQVTSKNLISGIYPNPVKIGQPINFNSSEASTVTIDVLSMAGKKVYSTTTAINAGSNSLSLSAAHLTAGVYYLSVTAANGSTQKIPVVVQ